MTVQHVTITAPGDSPNTDGIHVGRSTKVTINDTKIGTGDDCISVGDGTQQLTIEKVTCGPGHGISVGSLGKFPEEKEVVGVFVRNCTLTNTLNGVRIKTWPASLPGSASDMHFEDIIMNNAGTPVQIDQEYCPSNQCSKQVQKTKKKRKKSRKLRCFIRLFENSGLSILNYRIEFEQWFVRLVRHMNKYKILYIL